MTTKRLELDELTNQAVITQVQELLEKGEKVDVREKVTQKCVTQTISIYDKTRYRYVVVDEIIVG